MSIWAFTTGKVHLKSDGTPYTRADIDFFNMSLVKPSAHREMLDQLAELGLQVPLLLVHSGGGSITIMAADVARYTAISEKLDLENVHSIMEDCFKILMAQTHKYDGTINQFLGDGIMAIFGAPVTHEDHAHRACYAALSIQQALQGFNEKLRKQYKIDFRMRMGLNTGQVVVGGIGDDLRMDYMALGDTTNIAFLLEQKQGGKVIFPSGGDYFSAFDHTPIDKVKVVILGQDPYHGPGQAHGLCFSVPAGIRQPPSLLNIFKEIESESAAKGKELDTQQARLEDEHRRVATERDRVAEQIPEGPLNLYQRVAGLRGSGAGARAADRRASARRSSGGTRRTASRPQRSGPRSRSVVSRSRRRRPQLDRCRDDRSGEGEQVGARSLRKHGDQRLAGQHHRRPPFLLHD